MLHYENLLRKKQDPATALRNAKEKLRKDGYGEILGWVYFD